jgi:predicted nucleotidyltransferase
VDRIEELRAKILPSLLPWVTRVALFGSMARGEDTPESDADISVRSAIGPKMAAR